MDDFHFVNIYASKGIEYLLAIGFLILLVFAWRYLNQAPHKRVRASEGD